MTEGIARRAPPPRREDYAVVAGSRGPRRDFRITVGLREGWDTDGRVYDAVVGVLRRDDRAGLIPLIRPACPKVPGRMRESFSFASCRSWGMAS